MTKNILLILMAVGAFIALSIVLKTALALLPLIVIAIIAYSIFKPR